MTETQKKKALVKSLRRLAAPLYPKVDQSDLWGALVAAADEIERHEAFRQEVSDSLEHYLDQWRHSPPSREVFACQFGSFIIAKPDPMVKTVADYFGLDDECVSEMLKENGLKIVEDK